MLTQYKGDNYRHCEEAGRLTKQSPVLIIKRLLRPTAGTVGLAMTGVTLLLCFFLSSCAFVPQIKREHLSDPVMKPVSDELEQELDGHRFRNREGSTGGSSGAGGGCGC